MRQLIQWMIGEKVVRDDGYVYEIAGGWPWPVWVTVIVVVLCLAFFWGWYYRRTIDLAKYQRIILVLLRAGVTLAIIAMLAQWVVIPQRTSRPLIGIVLDDSMSMSVEDETVGTTAAAAKSASDREKSTRSRWAAAIDAVTSRERGLLHRLADQYRVRVYFLNDVPIDGKSADEVANRLKDARPQRLSTPLGRSILQVLDRLRGAPPAALVVFTDGVNNEGPSLADAAEEAARQFIPVFFVALGAEGRRPDVLIENWLMEERVFAGDKVVLRADIVTKHVRDKQVYVRLVDESNKNVFMEKKVDVTETGRQEVTMAFQPPRVGEIVLRLECQPVSGEVALENNSQTKILWVEKRAIRVLLIGNTPGFEYRFLQNCLGRESSITLRSVLLSADPELEEDLDNGLWLIRGAREEVWTQDVIILVDLPAAVFPPRVWEDLAGFVDRNEKPGGLVVIAGPNWRWEASASTPLARVLPISSGSSVVDIVADSASRVMPTDDGWRVPWFLLGTTLEDSRQIWSRLPGIYCFHDIKDIKPGARILATVEKNQRQYPVCIFSYVGRGRVLFHAMDETWRWRKVNNLMWYRQFWIELIRCMARSKLETGGGAILSTDRKTYSPGDPVWITLQGVIGQSDLGGEVTVWLGQDGRSRRQITLQRRSPEANTFQTVLHDLTPGQYVAWLAGERESVRTSFTVLPPKKEMQQTDVAWEEMAAAAKRTGGAVYRVGQIDRLIHSLPAGKASPVEILPPITLWNQPLILAFIVGMLTIEWALRKMWGLM
ncbi:MAG: vWA domain-containing protein [Thermogutta sp.]|nr:vWA domain-containing protein [Thermogutta terrifontis]